MALAIPRPRAWVRTAMPKIAATPGGPANET